jgi:hypothetical protein
MLYRETVFRFETSASAEKEEEVVTGQKIVGMSWWRITLATLMRLGERRGGEGRRGETRGITNDDQDGGCRSS